MLTIPSTTLVSFAKKKIHICLPITVTYMFGIIFNSFAIDYRINLGIFFLAAAFFLALHKLSLQKLVIIATFLGIFTLGGLLHNHQIATFEKFFTKTTGKTWNIKGRVINKETVSGNFPHVTTIALSGLQEDNGFYSNHNPWEAHQGIIVFNSLLEPYCKVDDEIEIQHLTFKKTNNTQYNTYLIKEGITTTLFIPKINYKILLRPLYSARAVIHNIRESLLRKIQHSLQPNTFALFSSLFLGNRATSKEELEHTKHYFAMWGLSHFLARSGLHLAIFATILEVILRYTPFSITIKHILSVLVSLLYFLLSWSSISFIRALAMFMLYKTCALLITRIQVFHILTLVTLGTLLYNPMQLFFLDFQLSFGLTAALAWISTHASKKLF